MSDRTRHRGPAKPGFSKQEDPGAEYCDAILTASESAKPRSVGLPLGDGEGKLLRSPTLCSHGARRQQCVISAREATPSRSRRAPIGLSCQTLPDDTDDDIPPEIDFSGGQRGKFYRQGVALRLPVYLDAEVQRYLAARAGAKDRRRAPSQRLTQKRYRVDRGGEVVSRAQGG